jgi:hypothetical protein
LKQPFGCFNSIDEGTSRLRDSRWDEKAGAIFRQQTKSRGRAQPEERDGATRGAGGSHPFRQCINCSLGVI